MASTKQVWQGQIQKASFRGVAFFVRASESEFGRRTKAHEYPLRDRPYVEDMGRKARQFTVEAIILGSDYMTFRDRLLAALEAPGPGRLVHPYLGEMTVSVAGVKMRESTDEGGTAQFSIGFVESGDANFPSKEVNRQAELKSAADRALEAAANDCKANYRAAGLPKFVAANSEAVIAKVLADAAARNRGPFGAELARDIAAINQDLITVIYNPASAAQAIVATLKTLVQEVAQSPRDALGLARPFFRFGSDLPPIVSATTSRKAESQNQAQLVQLTRTAAVAEGAKAATGITFDSYQDAINVRDELVDAIDDVMLGSPSDALYEALRALRASVVMDVAARGADLARVVGWTPKTTMPGLVVAQAVYADATRADELLVRNAVRHPLFVPGAQVLEVLSDG